jgi:glutathione S-transferase
MDFTGEVVLHGSGTSPFVRKVRVALIELGVPHVFAPAAPWSAQGQPQLLNPLKKVPVLQLSGGHVLFDSKVIVQYLDLRCAGALLPVDRSARIEVLQAEALADGVGDAAALLTQEAWRASAARSAFWMTRQRDKIVSGIDALEQSLTRWSATDLPNCIAPIAVRSALGFVSFWQPELDWACRAPRLSALCGDLDARPAWTETVPKLPAGASFPSL